MSKWKAELLNKNKTFKNYAKNAQSHKNISKSLGHISYSFHLSCKLLKLNSEVSRYWHIDLNVGYVLGCSFTMSLSHKVATWGGLFSLTVSAAMCKYTLVLTAQKDAIICSTLWFRKVVKYQSFLYTIYGYIWYL